MDTNEGRAKDEARFFIDHGCIHDRLTGKHVHGDRDVEPGTADEAVAMLNDLAARASTPSPAPEVGGAPCSRCGGTGVVDDGEITCSEGGIPYENGPVKCVKDCPACKGAAPQPAADVMGVLAELVALDDLATYLNSFENQDRDLTAAECCEYAKDTADYLGRKARMLESARRALAAGADVVPALHPLDALLPEICQLIDTIKVEWTQQGSWSEWDQSVRDRIAAYNIAKMKGASAGADAAGAVPDGEHQGASLACAEVSAARQDVS